MAEPTNPAKLVLKRVIRGYKNNLEVWKNRFFNNFGGKRKIAYFSWVKPAFDILLQ